MNKKASIITIIVLLALLITVFTVSIKKIIFVERSIYSKTEKDLQSIYFVKDSQFITCLYVNENKTVHFDVNYRTNIDNDKIYIEYIDTTTSDFINGNISSIRYFGKEEITKYTFKDICLFLNNLEIENLKDNLIKSGLIK